MKLPRYSHTAIAALVASLIARAYCFVRLAFDRYYLIDRVATVFWPAPNTFRPTEGYEDPSDANTFIILCIAANVLLYLAVFSAAWGVARVARARSGSFRDGKTI